MLRYIVFCCLCFSTTLMAQDGTLKPKSSSNLKTWIFEFGGNKGTAEATTDRLDSWSFTFNGLNTELKLVNKDDWSHWTANDGEININTFKEKDWDHWQVSGNNNLRIRTQFQADLSEWEVSGEASYSITRTYQGNNNEWQFVGDFSEVGLAAKMAIVFFPIFSDAIYNSGSFN